MGKLNVGVIGATGMVGAEIVSSLEQERATVGSVRLFASADSAGEVYKFADDEVVIEVPTAEALQQCDIVINAVPPEQAIDILALCAKISSLRVIDISGTAKRQGNKGSLIAPQLEARFSREGASLVTLAAPAVGVVLPLVFAVKALGGIESISVLALLPASSRGRAGQDELFEQSRAIFTQSEMPQEVFGRQVAFNAFAGSEQQNADFAEQLRELSGCSQVVVSAAQVPVFVGVSSLVELRCSTPRTAAEIEEKLRAMPFVTVVSGEEAQELSPSALDVAGTSTVHVSQVTVSKSDPRVVTAWCVADNIQALTCAPVLEALKMLSTGEM